jgi:hypothetical protein
MRRVFGIAVLALGLVGLMGAPASAQATEHCPDHEGHPGKVEATNSELNDVVLPAGTLFCIKAGTDATSESTGILESDGETTLCEYLIQAGIVDGTGEDCRDVSYYVVYEYAPRTDTTALAGGQVPVEFSGGTSPLLIVALLTIVGFVGARVAFGRIARRS